MQTSDCRLRKGTHNAIHFDPRDCSRACNTDIVRRPGSVALPEQLGALNDPISERRVDAASGNSVTHQVAIGRPDRVNRGADRHSASPERGARHTVRSRTVRRCRRWT